MKILKSITALIIIIPVLVFSACKPKAHEETQDQGLLVRVEIVKSEEIQPFVRSSGRLFPSSEQKLAFKTGGIVNKIYVSEGQTVKQGQLLAQLKTDEVSAMVSQATQAVEKTRRDYRRVSNLYRDTVATLEQYENVLTALKLAESQLEIAQFNLQYSSIRAPGEGKILRKLVENNEMVAPGFPVFLYGSTKGTWLLKVNVTDREVVLIETGDSAIVNFDAHPGKEFQARVTEKSAMANPYTGLFEITLELTLTEYQLVTGFIGRAVIFSGEKMKALSVPVDALVEAQGTEGVLNLFEDGKAVRRNIQILRIEGDRLLVSEGLSGDELVITEGTLLIKQGSKLRSIHSK